MLLFLFTNKIKVILRIVSKAINEYLLIKLNYLRSQNQREIFTKEVKILFFKLNN